MVRFQRKAGESKIGVMIDAKHVAEITGAKSSSEPILEFLSDSKAESKAQVAAGSAKKHLDDGKQSEKGYWRLDSVTVLPPIARPSKIICMGGNFSDHLAEGKSSLPPFPVSFLKAPTSLIGHRAPIIYPRTVKLLDYEVELATIIGKRCKNIPKEDALQYVAGFSVFNDISARDIQFAEMKRGFCNLGKNFDTFGPIGPCLVTPDQSGNLDNLGMELRVNGQTRQQASTRKMVFKVRELVEFFSSMTLEPGDIITSGTPSGVAIYRKPDKEPYLLRPGDSIEAKIENLGRLQNTVVDVQPPYSTSKK
ncbi:fumarylacetoacetate hydrolase family protein [Candidatus Bathyarchaeota archaeon]|nr:MAG: fumarylacetoacetate hydrolase family protein [Candidatus Bathyarchaeota archaeon]